MRKRIALGVLVVVVAAAALFGRRFVRLARIGSGYAAEQTCACMFISGRALESCRRDLEPLAQKIVSLRPGHDEVRASAALVFSARAVYDPRFGCTLVE